MSIAAQEIAVAPEAVETVEGPLYRLSVEQYEEMVRSGILTEDDRCELLEGVLVAKMGTNPPHTLVTKLIFDALYRAVPAGWHVCKEDPIKTPDSVPEPDCAIWRGNARDYAHRLPTPADMALVVEVSDSTLRRDRNTKRRAYARAGIPVYWLANLVDNVFEVYSDPTGPAKTPEYRDVRTFGPEDAIPLVIDGREIARIAVRDLLP